MFVGDGWRSGSVGHRAGLLAYGLISTRKRRENRRLAGHEVTRYIRQRMRWSEAGDIAAIFISISPKSQRAITRE
jgi:hypothetical protein